MSFTLSVSDINSSKPLFYYFNIFLITPWYDFDKNSFYKTRLSKCYGCVIILDKFLWIWVIVSNFKTESAQFNDGLFSLKFIQFLWVLVIILRTVFIVLKGTAWDVAKWKTLITNLQKVDSELQNVGRRATLLDNFYCKFLIQHVLFGIFASYQLFTWTEVLGVSPWAGLYMGPILDFYREVLIVILMNLLLGCLKRRYADLNERLQKSFTTCTLLYEIESMTQTYRILGETIDAYSDIFGYQTILLLFGFGLGVIGCLNYIFIVFVHFSDSMYLRFLISNIISMVFVTCNFLVIVLPMDSTVQEAKRFVDLSYKLREQCVETSREDEALTKLIDCSKNFHPAFTAAGFFHVDKCIIFSLIGNVATYYIITIQLNESQINKNSTFS